MFKSVNQWIVVAALILGGTFEMIKRFKPGGAAESAGETESLHRLGMVDSKPYVHRADPEDAMAKLAQARAQARSESVAVAPQHPLIIPPQSGSFESNPIAKPNTSAQNGQKKPGAEKVAAHKKKCRKKPFDPNVPQPQELQAEPIDTSIAVAAAPKNGAANEVANDSTEECVEDEAVADKDKSDKTKDEHDESDKSKPTGHSDQIADAGTFGGGLPTGLNKENELIGLEEWKTRLLYQPNFKETVRLIEAFQTRNIANATFYALVDLMLNDSRPEMRELGVLAAGRTPGYESFHALIKVIRAETFDSKLRKKAVTELATYQQLSFLNVLERVMRNSNDVYAVVFATRNLEDSAKHYLTLKTPAPTAGKTHPYAALYQKFLVVLTDISKKSHDAEESSQARQTLLSLQTLLKV